MKEGDIIYCIKNKEYLWDINSAWDFEQFIGEKMIVFHKKGVVTICNIKDKEYIINLIDEKNNRIYVNSEDNTTPYNIYGFSEKQFNKHFIYGKQYRKLKLKKLNENNKIENR